jgi:hypothetical protein
MSRISLIANFALATVPLLIAAAVVGGLPSGAPETAWLRGLRLLGREGWFLILGVAAIAAVAPMVALASSRPGAQRESPHLLLALGVVGALLCVLAGAYALGVTAPK